jgi:hypothetical protein
LKGKAVRVLHDSDKGASSTDAVETWRKEAKDVRKAWVDEATDPAEKALRERVDVVTTTRDKYAKATDALEAASRKAAKAEGADAAQSAGKLILKRLAPKAMKVIPFVGIGAGLYSTEAAAAEGNYGEATLEAVGMVPLAGDVVDAARLGVAIGEVGSELLGIDDVAQEHGTRFQQAAQSLGFGEDSATLLGATAAAVSSITVAPQIALQRKLAGLFQ